MKTNDPSDNLRIRLRWGTPDQLRRLSLLSYGFDVWRLPASVALANNYNLIAPSLSALTNGAFTLVNSAPIIASKDFSTNPSGAGSASDPADTTTYFFSDSNGRGLGVVNFPPTPPTNYPTGHTLPACGLHQCALQ